MRFLLAAALFFVSCSANAGWINTSHGMVWVPDVSFANPPYGAPPVGGIIDNTIDAAADRFVSNYEIKVNLQRRGASAYSYAAPVYAPQPAPMVYAAPTPQAFYVPATGTYATSVVANPYSPSGYSTLPAYTAPVYAAPVAVARPVAGYTYSRVYPSGKTVTRTYSWAP
jgi:hypothetical protein